ncbi:MAG: DNA mismatch repair endonuclease MutL [Deltaproteobacteria bacterium]|nr:DNA mismatch repair endonuclease MutL [Candidatus Tharpella sp.]
MSRKMHVEIRLLPPEVCSQIAAGEVVERPASVVKELVENALDAGADQIKVVIGEGGKNLIEVIDNGHGMDAAQARLALERHATSKISSAADLFGVSSYGFRGEALPSIAAVSRFSLTTRTRDMEAAVKIDVAAGGEVREESVGAPVGTKVTVADLFYSVPARKKFLKTTNTERGAILERMQRFAMSHPECSFLLEHNGRRLLNVTRGDRESDRVAAVLGLKPNDQLRELPEAGGDELKVRGYVSLPVVQRSNSRHLYFFVNRRAVRDKALLQALLKAYEGTLPRGRYPAAALFLTVADGAVDVNVHPAKEEVRFADGGRLFGLIRQAVAESLSGYPSLNSTADFFAPAGGARRGADESGAFAPDESQKNSLPPTFYDASGLGGREPSGDSSGLTVPSFPRSVPTAGGDYRKAGQRPSGVWCPNSDKRGIAEPRPSDFSSFSLLSSGETEALPGLQGSELGFFSAMMFVGSLWNAYIILQSNDRCYLLDQHAAHERVLFEDLKRKRLGSSAVQRLLLPVQVECTPGEEAQAQEYQELLNTLGFEFESLGPRTLILQTVPMLVDGLEVDTVFLETLADIASGGRGQDLAAIDAMLARLACRMAVKASQSLSVIEVRSLLEKLDKTPLAHTCPHGRPLYFRLDRGEIEKRFQR